MGEEIFDFVVVGGGSAGGIMASRLSEDPTVKVALLEAGQRPPPESTMPGAAALLQMNPNTDWMYWANAGKAAQGMHTPGVMHQPRGKMLGGSSAINYMMYVRGHPGDYDSWAKDYGAAGWSYKDVLPFFKKSEGLSPQSESSATNEIVVDQEAHSSAGPLGVSVVQPVKKFARDFVEACEKSGLPQIDYNGTTRGGPQGGVSLTQHSIANGTRSSTYARFLAAAETRPNLKVISGAMATKVRMNGLKATGVEYRVVTGDTFVASARREVILSAGAYGSPHLMMLSGIGPKAELEAAGVKCVVDNPHVGKHMKDHLMTAMYFPAPGSGITERQVATSMGPDGLRGIGELPEDPREDKNLPADRQKLKAESERQITEWATKGVGLPATGLVDACAFFSTGLGDQHTHDVELICFGTSGNDMAWNTLFHVDPKKYFGEEVEKKIGTDSEAVIIAANPVQPHSEGEVKLVSSDPMKRPELNMNYMSDPYDMKVMQASMRRVLEISKSYGDKLGPVQIPDTIAKKHNYKPGGEITDAMLEDWVLHYASTVYHPVSSCRIGEVVDPLLRVRGVEGLRVCDASVMPNIMSGNTNAPTMMIGEKGAEMVAEANGVVLEQFVKPKVDSPPSRPSKL